MGLIKNLLFSWSRNFALVNLWNIEFSNWGNISFRRKPHFVFRRNQCVLFVADLLPRSLTNVLMKRSPLLFLSHSHPYFTRLELSGKMVDTKFTLWRVCKSSMQYHALRPRRHFRETGNGISEKPKEFESPKESKARKKTFCWAFSRSYCIRIRSVIPQLT